MKKLVILLFILFLIWNDLFSQPIRFEQITNESGRSLGFVSGMVQDSTGFIWLATRNGLYRYDGYSYRLFRHNRRDSTSLPNNDLTYLYLDYDNNIWLRHYNKLFAFKDEKIYYPNDYIKDNTYDLNTRILQDVERNYWIGPIGDKIVKVSNDKVTVDTFTMATELAHPGIVKWFNSATPDYKTTKDTIVEFLKKTKVLILSTGEGNFGSYYDFGSLEKGKEEIWNAKDDFKPVKQGKSLFRISYKVIMLEPGNYTIKFSSDETNSFSVSENPIPFYGTAIYIIDDQKEVEKLANISYFPPNSIHAAQLKNILINRNGRFTILTENGVHEIMDEKWQSYPFDFTEVCGQKVLSEGYNMPFLQSKNGNYWVAFRNGLIYLDDEDVEVVNIFDDPQVIYNLTEDHDGNILFASRDGLYTYNPKRNLLKHYEQDTKNRLYTSQIWDVMEDRSYNTWIATTEGLNRLKPSRFDPVNLGVDKFAPYPIEQIDKNLLLTHGNNNQLLEFNMSTNDVQSIEMPVSIFPVDDFSGEPEYDITDIFYKNASVLLTFSNRVALFSYPEFEVLETTKIPDFDAGDQVIDNHALYIVDGKEMIWVFAIDGVFGLDSHSLELKRTISFNEEISSVFDMDSRFVKDLVFHEGMYYVRTATALWKFNSDKGELKRIIDLPEGIIGTSLANGNCFIDTARNKMWFSVLPGIYSLNLEDEIVDTINIKLDMDLGDCMTYVNDSNIWVATNSGLIKYTFSTGDHILYNSSDGFADNNVNGVFPDSHGNIWLTSLKGLTEFEVATEKSTTYFRSNDFYTLNFLRLHYRHPHFEEWLLLPTTEGYMKFKPDSLNRIKPPIAVSNIYLFGKEAKFDSLAHEKRYIELPYSKNFITFELASLDYTDPSKNMYRYKMENFNEDWIYADATNRKAPYTGIQPGSYVFVAQATNNDGIWSEPLRIRLIIHPPWYRTIIAYISYVLLITLTIISYIRYRERKLKEEKRILEEKVVERTKEIRKQNEEIIAQRDEIAAQKKDITDSIHYASRIQSALLPSTDFAKSVLNDHFILFKPRDIVSGDYYWLAEVDNKTIVVAADCTGHGVPGAFMSMLGVAFLNEIVSKDHTLSSNHILDKLREHVIKSLKQSGKEGGSKDGMDIALTIIDHETLQAQFSGAYNPLYIVRDNELDQVKADKMPIGYHIKVDTPFTCKEVELQKNDRLYMFSDGYPDQFGGDKGRKFMSKRFKQLLVDTSNLPMNEQKEELDKAIEAWKGGVHDQIDDILVIGVRI